MSNDTGLANAASENPDMEATETPFPIAAETAYGRPPGAHDAELTEVGPGTPCGEFLRRYWQPVAVSEKVTQRPQKLRILGEDLVLFRDGKGRPGLLTPHCVHRGASLYYGKVDDVGIRCCYHGWQFDVEGRCMDQPCEPDGGLHRDRVRQPWYPVQERYGLVFAYMGPPGKRPILPRWDALEGLDKGERIFSTDSSFSVGGDDSITVLPWNWLQDWENSTDPFHVWVLHSSFSSRQFSPEMAQKPDVSWALTPLGMHYVARRTLSDGRHLDRISPLLFPNIISTPDVDLELGPNTSLGWVVPIDDTSHRRFHAMRVPVDLEGRPRQMYEEKGRPARWIDMSEAQRQDYPSDWEAMSSQGAITRHSAEHLARSDIGVVMLRRLLRQQIQLVKGGGDPMGVSFNPDAPIQSTGGGNFCRSETASTP
jgi:phenylpropionate dioxygenase-like ring-hydroxylating dioxygenase large terminal subunit